MFKPFFLTAIAAATIISTSSAQGNNQEYTSVSYHGSLNVIPLEPTLMNQHRELLAGVKAYDFDIENATSICGFVGNKALSVGSLDDSEWKCHFEWVGGIENLNISGSTIQGIFPSSGALSMPYEISVYSGSDERKITILRGEYEFEVLAPEQPQLASATVDWVTEELSGFEQFIGYPNSRMSKVRLGVAPRNYDQVISINGKECFIQEGRNICELDFSDSAVLGNINEHGRISAPIVLNSATGYFEDADDILDVTFDFRPPVFSGFYVNDSIERETKHVETERDTLELEFNQAAVVFNTEQDEDNTTWWMPNAKSIRLTPIEGGSASSYKDVLGSPRFFDIPYVSGARERKVSSPEIRRLNGQVAYIYDIENISDGIYTATVDSRNQYQVGESSENSDDTIISRYAPALEFFTHRTQVRDRVEIHFASDLAISAFGGWEDGTEVTEVTIDGTPVEFTSLTDDHQTVHLPSTISNLLVQGESYKLSATATNGKGITTQRSIEIIYAPTQYVLSGVPQDLYRKVEPLRISARRQGGTACTFVDSEETAHAIASTSRYGCYPRWQHVPDGTAPLLSGQNPSLYGAVREEGSQTDIALDIVYVSHIGEELVFSTPTYNIGLLEPQPIDLGMVPLYTNNDGSMILPEGSRDIARATLGFNRGIIDFEVMYQDDEPYMSRSISSSRTYIEGQVRVSAKRPFAHDLFAQNTLILKAWYRYAPEMRVNVERPFLLVPNESSRFLLTSEQSEGHTLGAVTVEASMEALFEREWTSDADKMGEYDVYIAREAGRNEYIPLTDTRQFENGKVTFELDLSQNLNLGNNTLVAIAALRVPDDADYEKNLTSRRLGFYLFSGEAIDGQLTTRTIQGPAPMRARMTWQAATLHESRLIEDYVWEVSQDGGSTWERDTGFTSHSYSKNHEEPADYMVRVRVKNRITGLETQSEDVRVIAYHTPRISIEGPSTIYRGIPEIYRITSRTGKLSDEDGEFYWSFDRVEWFEGTNELELNIEASTPLFARFISHSATGRELERSAEVEAARTIAVRTLAPVRIGATLPNLVEAGSSVILDAHIQQPIASLNYPVHVEWEDANGNVYQNGYEYEVTPEDINDDNSASFTARAWIQGMKEHTYAERVFRTRPWHYETPEIHIERRNSHQIAPVNVRLGVAHPAIFAPFVEIDYDWELPDGAELVSSNSRGRYVNVSFTRPGVYEIKAILRDSRGGEAIAYEYVDILEPASMEPELELRFSENHLRPPLRIVSRMAVRRTHPNDRMDSIIWYLNGEQVGEPRTTGYFDLTEPGTFEITGEVHTRLGQVASVTESVTLSPNQPPTCQPAVVETASVYRVETNCSDLDGRIVRYEWEWDEGISSQSRPTLSFSKASYESLSVTFRAYDDSGAHFEGTVRW